MKIKKIIVFFEVLTLVSFLVAAQSESTSTEGVSSEEALEKDILINKTDFISQGIVGVSVQKALGTFGLYAVSPDGSKTAVLSSRPAFSSSSFFLKAGDAVYQLNRLGGVRYTCSASGNKANIVYVVNKKKVQAEVNVSMEIQSTGASSEADMVKCIVQTKNVGKSAQSFSIRAVLDTVLGELAYTDFSTARQRQIDVETQFTSMFADRWIMSKNEVIGMQVLLSGKDITSPEFVTLANKDIISSGDWNGAYCQSGRTFNSILSYNNSAVDIIWNDFSLKPGERTSIVFYIVLGVQAVEPDGKFFLSGAAPVVSPVVEYEAPVSLDQNEAPAAENSSSYEEVGVPVEIQEAAPVDVPFDVSSIKQEQLDPVYVQSLVDKINSLESTDIEVDLAELSRLNGELDAILNILKGVR